MVTKWAKLASKVLASNAGRLQHPYKLTYVVTKECHSKCQNCDIWKLKPQNELTLGEIEKFTRNTPYLSWVDFTGGEPTDRKDFVEVIACFLQNCPDLLLIHFPTNGLVPGRIEDVAQRILKLRPPRFVVSVSIDGPPEINDQLRGIPNDFARAVETYRRLSAMDGLDVYVGMTLYRQNVKHIEATVEAIKQILPTFSYANLHVNIAHVSEHYYGNRVQEQEDRQSISAGVQSLMRQRGFPKTPFELMEKAYHKHVRKYLEDGKCPVPCSSLTASCYMAEDGTVYPCTIWNAPLGNIRDTGYSLEPLLRSEKAVELRGLIRQERCPHCWTPCEAYPTLLAHLWKW